MAEIREHSVACHEKEDRKRLPVGPSVWVSIYIKMQNCKNKKLSPLLLLYQVGTRYHFVLYPGITLYCCITTTQQPLLFVLCDECHTYYGGP